jgi:hypothetical protein
VLVDAKDEKGNLLFEDGKLVQEHPKCDSADIHDMTTFLLEHEYLNWMRLQQDFNDDLCEVVEVIVKAYAYATSRRADKVVLTDEEMDKEPTREEKLKALPKMEKQVRDSIYDYPMTVVQVVRFLKLKDYEITNDRVRQWVTREVIKPAGLVGKRPGYLPSEVIAAYNQKELRLEKIS